MFHISQHHDPLNTVDLYPGTGGDKKENIFPNLAEHRTDTDNARADGEILEVTVADPEKKGEGVYAYVSYKVNTKVTLTSFRGTLTDIYPIGGWALAAYDLTFNVSVCPFMPHSGANWPGQVYTEFRDSSIQRLCLGAPAAHQQIPGLPHSSVARESNNRWENEVYVAYGLYVKMHEHGRCTCTCVCL